jgi:branched-chain amino acid transport system permease protein
MPSVIGLFLVSGFAVGSLYALGGIGLVILRRSTGVLNLAYGAIAACSAMVAWQVLDWGLWQPVAWVAALLTGIFLSLIYGRLLAPHLADRDPSLKATATLGYLLILLGLMGLLWDDRLRSLELPTDKLAIMVLGVRITMSRMIVLAMACAAVVAISLYLDRTRIGLNMRAVADNRRHAALLGIPLLQVEGLAWGISGGIAGVTGLYFGSIVRLEPAVITFMVIPAIAAAVCGRLNSLPATLVGGLCIGVAESLLTLVPGATNYRSMAPYVIAGLIILWMQRGQRLTFAGGD